MHSYNYNVLILIKSTLFKNYLKEKMNAAGINVIISKDSMDTIIKMRNNLPDLIIIDNDFEGFKIMDFLKDKKDLKNTKDLPVFLLSSDTKKFDNESTQYLTELKVLKILKKPIEIDALFNTINSILMTKIEFDIEPCIIDVKVNKDILFIEVLNGLNKDKLELLKYRIIEIEEKLKIKIRNILITLTNMDIKVNRLNLLNLMIDNIILSTDIYISDIVILTKNDMIKYHLKEERKYKLINIIDNIKNAIEIFSDRFLDSDDFMLSIIENSISVNNLMKKTNDFAFNLMYSIDIRGIDNNNKELLKKEDIMIAVVDDDVNVLRYFEMILKEKKWQINLYDNGKSFLKDLKHNIPDLIFLDLIMPYINGFQILDYLHKNNLKIPVFVISTLQNKSYVMKAIENGALYYFTKPFKSDLILNKTEEVLMKKHNIA